MGKKSSEIEDIERQIEELKSRWPAHSVPPAMAERLDELEEDLARARDQAEKRTMSAPSGCPEGEE